MWGLSTFTSTRIIYTLQQNLATVVTHWLIYNKFQKIWRIRFLSVLIKILFQGQDVNSPHEVNHFQIHGWSSDGAPDDTTATTELAQMLNDMYMNGKFHENEFMEKTF